MDTLNKIVVDRYAVFGNPIEHSKSPTIHALFASQTNQNIEYTKLQVEIGGFTQAADHFFVNGGKGLNVTVPFKRDAFNYASEHTERALAAGAVNTLFMGEDQSIVGDNTDGVGLVNDLVKNLERKIDGKQVLILGAGGAVGGILLPLLECSPKAVVIVNRTSAKADLLVDAFAQYGSITSCSFDDLPCDTFDIVINGTSAGLSDEVPPLPANIFAPDAFAYDLVYGDEPTAFMRWSQVNGAAAVADGLGMLVEQAAESFYIWRGVKPEILPVLEELRRKSPRG